MADLIDRQAAISIALAKLTERERNCLINIWSTVEVKYWITALFEQLPSADAVEVVRCKDCKYRDADDFCTGRGYPNVLVPDDGFCDKGERRE